MLTEIYCDKFKTGGAEGKIRDAIHFHEGLNAVIGDENRSNSIGKSTLLMIIDFVFGGEDYINKCDAVHKNVGEHNIYFTLKFENKNYFFCRNTKNFKKIFLCDHDYKISEEKQPLSIEKYKSFLSKMYGLDYENLTWRGAVSNHIRIHNRETMDTSKPLASARKSSYEQDKKTLMKLFHKYSEVEEYMKKAADAEAKRDAFSKSVSYNQIKMAKNKSVYHLNDTKIKELEFELQKLASNSNKGLLTLSDVQSKRLTELNDELTNYYRQFYSIKTQLNNLRKDKIGEKTTVKNNYEELQKFFPEINLKEIKQIDEFHNGLTKVLNNEYTEKEKELETIYIVLNNTICDIKNEINSVKNVPNVTQAILNEYARLSTELNNTKAANEHFDELNELKEKAKTAILEEENVTKERLNEISNAYNFEMKKITERITNDKFVASPVLELDDSTYKFETLNDDGTGTANRSLVTFDLATLYLTNVPFLIHDSDLLDSIAIDGLSSIISEYMALKNIKKQAFVSFRSFEFYNKETEPILQDNKVILLEANGNELFGWAWNKEDDKK